MLVTALAVYFFFLFYFGVVKPKQDPSLSSSPSYLFKLCLLFGFFGVHRFREGKKWTGLLYLFTFGLFLIGWLYDLIRYISMENKQKQQAAIDMAEAKEREIEELRNGVPLPVVLGSGLFLSSGETCHFCDKASSDIPVEAAA